MTIDERLRDAFSAVDHDVTASPTAWSAITRRTAKHARRRNWVGRVGIAIASCAIAAGLLIGMNQRNRGPERVSTADQPTQSTGSPGSGLSVESSTTTSAAPAGGVPLQSVDWSTAVVLDCGSTRAGTVRAVIMQVLYPQPAPGMTVAVVMARCDAGAGSPPTSLIVYDRATSRTSAHQLQVLMDGSSPDGAIASGFTAADKTIRSDIVEYSSPNIPRCCPDQHYTRTWVWQGDSYHRLAGSQ
jgi:hypothetical protein